MANKYDDADGVWRTIGGRRVFIRNGQSLSDAMKESGKFNTKKKEEPKDTNKNIQQKMDETNDKIAKHLENVSKVAKEMGDEKLADINENASNYAKSLIKGDAPISERDAKDLLKQLNDEGSDFTFNEDVVIKDGKLITDVGVMMPWEDGYTSRELQIPLDDVKDYADLEEKLRDWEDRHRSVDDWENIDFEPKELDSKSVLDSDGFTTDYTLYEMPNGKYKAVFGDKDVYGPDADADMEFDNLKEAQEWFDDYKGFDDEDNPMAKYSKDIMVKDANGKEVNAYDNIYDMDRKQAQKYVQDLNNQGQLSKEDYETLKDFVGFDDAEDKTSNNKPTFANDKALNHKIWDADISSIAITTDSINDRYGYGFNEMLNTADREGLKVKSVSIGNLGQNKASVEFENGAKLDFYDLKEGKALINNADTDDFEKIQKALNTYRVKSKEDVSYDFNNGGWINNDEDTKIPGMNNSKYEAKYGNANKTPEQAKAELGWGHHNLTNQKAVEERFSKSTNDTMNEKIRNDASKKTDYSKYNDKATASFGKVDYYGNGRKSNEVSIDLQLKDGVFTASGDIWNSKHTDIVSGGQNIDEIADMMKGNKDIQEIRDLWKKYHLNDMHAGTEKQEDALEKFKGERKAIAEQLNKGKKYDWEKVSENDYEVSKKLLENHNLLKDGDYQYGTGWLKREIPDEDKERIIKLINKYNGKTDETMNDKIRRKAGK